MLAFTRECDHHIITSFETINFRLGNKSFVFDPIKEANSNKINKARKTCEGSYDHETVILELIDCYLESSPAGTVNENKLFSGACPSATKIDITKSLNILKKTDFKKNDQTKLATGLMKPITLDTQRTKNSHFFQSLNEKKTCRGSLLDPLSHPPPLNFNDKEQEWFHGPNSSSSAKVESGKVKKELKHEIEECLPSTCFPPSSSFTSSPSSLSSNISTTSRFNKHYYKSKLSNINIKFRNSTTISNFFSPFSPSESTATRHSFTSKVDENNISELLHVSATNTYINKICSAIPISKDLASCEKLAQTAATLPIPQTGNNKRVRIAEQKNQYIYPSANFTILNERRNKTVGEKYNVNNRVHEGHPQSSLGEGQKPLDTSRLFKIGIKPKRRFHLLKIEDK